MMRLGEVISLSPSCWAGQVWTEFPVPGDSLGSSLVEPRQYPAEGIHSHAYIVPCFLSVQTPLLLLVASTAGM